jgi:hypothetical protein
LAFIIIITPLAAFDADDDILLRQYIEVIVSFSFLTFHYWWGCISLIEIAISALLSDNKYRIHCMNRWTFQRQKVRDTDFSIEDIEIWFQLREATQTDNENNTRQHIHT